MAILVALNLKLDNLLNIKRVFKGSFLLHYFQSCFKINKIINKINSYKENIIKYEIIHLSWCKRRKPDIKKEINIESIFIPHFKKERGHVCKMFVSTKEQGEIELTAQVSFNTIKETWIINGINSGGDQIAIRLI